MTFYRKRAIFYIVMACFIAMLFTGCSFPGKVFVSFSWERDEDRADNWVHQIPKIDYDIDNIEEGKYYPTDPGNYTLLYNYTEPANSWIRHLDLPLEADITILGVENAYYDVIIAKNKPPACYKVPAEP